MKTLGSLRNTTDDPRSLLSPANPSCSENHRNKILNLRNEPTTFPNVRTVREPQGSPRVYLESHCELFTLMEVGTHISNFQSAIFY
jgi:hypothetical protein